MVSALSDLRRAWVSTKPESIKNHGTHVCKARGARQARILGQSVSRGVFEQRALVVRQARSVRVGVSPSRTNPQEYK